MAKKKRSQSAAAKTIRIISPKRELTSVRKEIRQIKSPVYALNRKIKNASSNKVAKQYRNERDTYLLLANETLNELVSKRTELAKRQKNFEVNQSERSTTKRKVSSLEKRIQDAVDDKDLKSAEKLRYELIKQLGILDKLHKDMGVAIPKTDVSEFDREDQEGGIGYILDERSPYAIWEAIKQLHKDLDSGLFKYFIVNGKRFSSENVIEIAAEASDFWLSAKEKKGGTPYINRFLNLKSHSVKYLLYHS